MRIETLVRMSEQIATNNRALGESEAIQRVAGHLKTFWTPVMRRELEAYAAFTENELDPIVLGALDFLAGSELDKAGSE